METDWAENRAKIPSDIIRNTLGKILDSLYSSGERMFRTRLELRGGRHEDIFISHRNSSVPGTIRAGSPHRIRNWSAATPRRLMVRLGTDAC